MCMRLWDFMPGYLKEIFLKAFSKEAIKTPAKRLRESDWLNVLLRYQSDIVRCPVCRSRGVFNEIFVTNATDTRCDIYRELYKVQNTIKLPAYSITAAKGTLVYRCQLGICNSDKTLNPVLHVVAKPNGTLGVENIGKWECWE